MFGFRNKEENPSRVWTTTQVTKLSEAQRVSVKAVPLTNLRNTEMVLWMWKVLSRVHLCDPMGYTDHGILQARTLEWGAVPFSRGSSRPRDRTQVCRMGDRFLTIWATREASICQQIWKIQQWPQDWKRSVFIPIPKKGNAKEISNYCTIAVI